MDSSAASGVNGKYFVGVIGLGLWLIDLGFVLFSIAGALKAGFLMVLSGFGLVCSIGVEDVACRVAGPGSGLLCIEGWLGVVS